MLMLLYFANVEHYFVCTFLSQHLISFITLTFLVDKGPCQVFSTFDVNLINSEVEPVVSVTCDGDDGSLQCQVCVCRGAGYLWYWRTGQCCRKIQFLN